MTGPVVLIIAIVLCLLGNGFFSGAEIAVISAKRSRIQALVDEGSKAAARVQRLQDNPDSFLATVQMGVTLMGTLAGLLGGYLASRHVEPTLMANPYFAHLPWAAAAIVGAGIVYVELTLGELVPKGIALRYAESAALVVSWPLLMLSQASRIFIRILTASTRAVLRLFGIRNPPSNSFVSHEELKHLIREGKEQGVIDASELEMIHSVFDFSDTPVRKVMIPRPKVFALDAATPSAEVANAIIEGGFSRIPVFEESVDNIIGVVYVKDLLPVLDHHEPILLRKLLRPVHFVPETKKVGPLLKDLQRRRIHLAIVLDEHGSVAGIVTLEDLLEEIVGEIHDEHDWEERPVERLRDGAMVVEGTLSASTLRERYQVPVPESSEFETVAGFMLDRLGSVPRGGEVVETEGYRLTVVDVEKNRVSKVKIEKVA
jgi:putative hemolysin